MHTEIVKQINDLPIAERVEIIEEVSRGVKRDLRRSGNGDSETNGPRAEVIAERKQAIDRLRGIAAVPGRQPPNDEEWRDERTNYLLEKHK